jgi:hypothetical protein
VTWFSQTANPSVNCSGKSTVARRTTLVRPSARISIATVRLTGL